MKKIIVLALVFLTVGFDTQKDPAFDTGEWFKFRIHYGLITAGYATLEVREGIVREKKVYHAVGKGYTTGVSSVFFKVEDNYESYFDKISTKPYQYVRQINEGGYTKNEIGFFNQNKNTILVKDIKNNTEKAFSTPEQVQDIVSTFYYLRNHPSVDKLKVGESIAIDMFFDNETTKFKLKFMGREDIDTKFGIIPTMVFKPLKASKSAFKEPTAKSAFIRMGNLFSSSDIHTVTLSCSLKADLDAFKGLKNQFTIKED